MKRESPPQTLLLRLGGLLALSLVGGFALGVAVHRHWSPKPRERGSAGFDLREPAPRGRFGAYVREAPAPPPAEAPADRSGLDMVRTGPMRAAIAPKAQAQASPAGSVTSLIRKNEFRYESLAIQYTRRYPVIREYGRDWASFPDLRRFNQEYLHDRDPIRFAFQVAASPNFAALVKKYSARPEMRQFIADVVRITPSQLADAAADYLNKDERAVGLVKRFSLAMGLPENFMASAASSTAAPEQALPTLQTDEQFRKFVQQGR